MTKRKQKFACPECDKELKNARSLAGHMWFAHNIRYGEKPNLRRKIEKLENEPRITDDIAEKIKEIRTIIGDVQDGILKTLHDFHLELGSLAIRLDKLESAKPGNPGNPGGPNPGPEDPNPEEVKSDEEKVKSDEEEDDGLPNFFGWLFGKKKKSDDEKKSEEDDDDNSSLL